MRSSRCSKEGNVNVNGNDDTTINFSSKHSGVFSGKAIFKETAKMAQALKMRSSRYSKEGNVNVNGNDDTNINFLSKHSGSSKVQNLWLASNPSKRWGEVFFLLYTPFWLTLSLGIVVPYRLYERFKELEYLLLGLVSVLPSLLLPFVLVGKEDRCKNWYDRYWAKAHLWIMILSYVGNYFWTHYFFKVLGASYTFPSWRMNDVPHTTFFLAHACFLFYHAVSNITLRRLRHAISELPNYIQFSIEAVWILALSYFIAFLETFSIANFPYYDFVDRAAMYKVGSLFYAVYFLVSFPMFIRLDEKPGDPWSLSRTTIDALATTMLITILLDFWRLFLGPVVMIPAHKECPPHGLPWMS